MAGLRKAKKYDWKDSNLALFGSDTEKQVKKESAESEPAWTGCGQEESLKIWRIVKFQVKEWPKEDYGKFYTGDSYIILNTYKPDPGSEELAYDVHFWIGKESTQDEYGTAAYKTVELDTYLNDAAIQHREVQGQSSDLFKSYFGGGVTIMKGGADTGFRHVTPEEYKPRLLHFSGTKRHVQVKEVGLNKKYLTENDVFILDLGLKIYQWNGSACSKDEKFKAMQYMSNLKSERGKAETETLDDGEGLTPGHPFYEALTDEEDDDDDEVDSSGPTELFKISDASGSLNFDKIKEGDVSKSDLGSDDVFLVDLRNALYVWIGKNASPAERKNAMSYAHNHLMKTDHALSPITVIKEGQKNSEFETAMAA